MTRSLDGQGVLPGVPTQPITDPQKVSHPDREVTADGDGLAVSLAGLARLALGRLDLDDVLTRLTILAAAAIPGAEGAGVTPIETGQACSAPFVREVDEIQYGLGQGPSVSTVVTGQAMRSGSIGEDRRWPQFGTRVARLGVHSVLSLPLISHDTVVGSLNLYSHAKHAFDEHAEHLGGLFAMPAAIVVQNAQILAKTRRLAKDIQAAMTDRAVIDQAIGILMSRLGVSAEEASTRLRMLSQRKPGKVAEVAEGVVRAAVHRAHLRHPNRN